MEVLYLISCSLRILLLDLLYPIIKSLFVRISPKLIAKGLKGEDREKSAVFKELTQSFRTYELRGQAKKKKSSNRIKDKQVPHTLLQKLSPKSLTSPLNKDIDLKG